MTNLPTKAVKAVIRNSKGEILFLRRHKSRGGTINWDLPGGLIEEGEDAIFALQREILEEIGRIATIGQELGTWSFFREKDKKTVEVQNYEATLDSEGIELSAEHDEARWITEEDIKTLVVKDSSILRSLH